MPQAATSTNSGASGLDGGLGGSSGSSGYGAALLSSVKGHLSGHRNVNGLSNGSRPDLDSGSGLMGNLPSPRQVEMQVCGFLNKSPASRVLINEIMMDDRFANTRQGHETSRDVLPFCKAQGRSELKDCGLRALHVNWAVTCKC